MGILVVLLLGMFASLVSIGSQTEVQILVENRLRGRVMSLWTLVIMGGPAVGSVSCRGIGRRHRILPIHHSRSRFRVCY